jgi:hypothetical protein
MKKQSFVRTHLFKTETLLLRDIANKGGAEYATGYEQVS